MDIPRLAIRKTMDYTKTPLVSKYECAKVRNTEKPNRSPDFEEIDLQCFEVYTREVRKYEAPETATI
jgi:hypothetical protein